MIIPDSGGYTLFETDTSEMSKKTTRYLFQHNIKKYYYLYDRLLMVSPDLKVLNGYIEKVSPSWQKRLRGRVLTHFLKAFVVFSANPQHYGGYGDYIMASNYGRLIEYLKRLVKMMIKVYGIPSNKYYGFGIKKDELYYLSGVFASRMIPDTMKLVPKYESLMSKQ